MSDPQTPERREMTIDERLRYLLASSESLHDQLVQFIEEGLRERQAQREAHQQQREQQARQEALDKRERTRRVAVIAAIQAYLDALEEGDA
jgi:hypothetical protein